MSMTEKEWKQEFRDLHPPEREEVARQLLRKLKRFGGEEPPSEEVPFIEYVWQLRERAKEAKLQHDAAMDRMVALHEDGSYTLEGETPNSDPLSLRINEHLGAVSLSLGEGKATYFTPLEIRRFVLILKELSDRIEAGQKQDQ